MVVCVAQPLEEHLSECPDVGHRLDRLVELVTHPRRELLMPHPGGLCRPRELRPKIAGEPCKRVDAHVLSRGFRIAHLDSEVMMRLCPRGRNLRRFCASSGGASSSIAASEASAFVTRSESMRQSYGIPAPSTDDTSALKIAPGSSVITASASGGLSPAIARLSSCPRTLTGSRNCHPREVDHRQRYVPSMTSHWRDFPQVRTRQREYELLGPRQLDQVLGWLPVVSGDPLRVV